MKQVVWWLLELICRGLDADEGEAVLGDFAESSQSAARALSEATGLVLRRQAGLWKDWRPWVGLVAVAGVAAVPLSRFTFSFGASLGQQVGTYRRYGVRFETGLSLGQDLAYLTCLCSALLLWSWAGGFVLGSLSGRTIWLTGAAFYLVVLDAFRTTLLLSGNIRFFPWWPLCWRVLSLLFPFSVHAIVFLGMAIWGMRQGVRLRTLDRHRARTLAVAITILTALMVWMEGWYEEVGEIYSGGAWHGPAWYARLPQLLFVTWPVWYLLVTSTRQSGEPKHGMA